MRSWLVPRLPIQPAWRYGKLVRIVLSVADPVAVVEVVDRDLAVEEDGLLDALEAEQCGRGSRSPPARRRRRTSGGGCRGSCLARASVSLYTQRTMADRSQLFVRHRLDGARALRRAPGRGRHHALRQRRPVHGRDAVHDTWAGFCEGIDGVSHERDRAVGVRGRRRRRGERDLHAARTASTVTVPVVTIYREGDGGIDDYRIFMDVAPLFA